MSALVSLDDGQAVTTTLVIAEGTAAQHASVIRLVRESLSDFEEFGRVGFEIRPFETAGGRQERTVAVLNEQQATLLMTYMRNSDVVREFKKRLVHAFYELAASRSRTAPALTDDEIVAQALAITTHRVKELESVVEELAPDANAWRKLADSDGNYGVGDAAKILSQDPAITIGRNRLFAFMAERKWIYRHSGRRGGWCAYQSQVDLGRLHERPATPFLNRQTGEYELPAPTIRITIKGLAELHRLMGASMELAVA